MKHKNLTILGTSHIAKQSLRQVKRAIIEGKPKIVALELDRKRLAALLEKEPPKARIRDIKRIGIKGFLFSLIGAWAEKKLGKETGVSPGSEMKLAYEIARKKDAKIMLIDQDIEVTLRKISRRLTWKEKWRFVVDVFKAVVLRKREVIFDLRKVPSAKVIKKLTSKVKERYPNVYSVLVEERNAIMAKNIAKLCIDYPDEKILAIIGAGHEKEIMEMVKAKLDAPRIGYSFTIN